jgi:pimeloyl-ACP methyl ester carboxylesterase
MSSGECFAKVGRLELCYETFGDDDVPPLLLVMGFASQMILWEDEFCTQLAERGFRVIRFDNRDSGRSTILRDAPVPTIWQLLRRARFAAAYSLEEMAVDAAGLLDHLGVRAAHVVGASMGGLIAQLLTIHHPERVLSLVSIMSSTGSRRVGQIHPLLLTRLLRRPRSDREGYIEDFVATFRAIGSKRYPLDPVQARALAARCFDRGYDPAGSARQLGAIVAASDQTRALRAVRAPTTVIHGDADRLVMPSGGRAIARAIPGARLVVVPGMGHDLPRALWLRVTDSIVENAARARGPATSPDWEPAASGG